MQPMTEHRSCRAGGCATERKPLRWEAGGAAVRVGSPAASGRHPLDSTTLPICEVTGEDVDDCDCLLALAYDEQDEDDLRRKCDQEERD